VQVIVTAVRQWHMSPDQVADEYGVRLTQVQAALDFYGAHQAEIDAALDVEARLEASHV
jgi:uncharacterized protein (DUF433 family)